MSDLNIDLAKQAFKLNSKTYNDHDTGTFVMRIVEDPARIIDSLATVVDTIISIITSLIMLIYIFTLSAWISLVLLAIIIIGFVLEWYRVRIRRKNRAVVRKKNDRIHSLTTEIVRSEKDIKSLGLEGKLSEVSKEYYNDFRKERYKLDIVDMNFWSSRNFVINIGILCALLFGIWLMDKAWLTIATFMIVYSNRGSLWDMIFGIGNLANSFIDIKVCHGRMFSLFDEDEFVTEKFGEKRLKNVVGEIEFKDVSYTFKEYEYKEPTSEEMKKKKGKDRYKKEKIFVSENKIFDKLSFSIQPNTTVAFVGKSGSGKSTILNLMSKMYEADSGEVLIDGVDIKELDKETLRSTISLVNQFPYIFDMTIKENLLLAKKEAKCEEIDDAIKKASLDEFVSSLPKGVETKVGESGIKLSGGQKQRISIARAFLKNSPILILDEATSALDNMTEMQIQSALSELAIGRTTIVVAHRLSTVKNADTILVLTDGVITERGSHEELVANGGTYAELYRYQFKE